LTGAFDIPGPQKEGVYRVPIWVLGGDNQPLWQYVEIEVTPNDFDWQIEDVTPDHILNVNPRWISIWDNKSFIADYDRGLVVFDVSDPLNPVHIADIKDIAGYNKEVYAIEVIDDLAYVIIHDQTEFPNRVYLRIYDVTSLPVVTLVSESLFSDFEWDISELVIYNGLAFGLSDPSGLHVFDIDPPSEAHEIDAFELDGYNNPISFSGAYLIHPNGSGSVAIRSLDAENGFPVLENIDMPYIQGTVYAYEGYLYAESIMSPDYAIDVYNIDPIGGSDLQGQIIVPQSFRQMTVHDGNLYTVKNADVRIYSLADPVNPVEIRSLDAADSLNLTGEFDYQPGLFFAWGENVSILGLKGTHLIDTSDPSSAAFTIHDWFLPETAMAAGNGYLYKVGYNFLGIYDVDPPEDTQLVKLILDKAIAGFGCHLENERRRNCCRGRCGLLPWRLRFLCPGYRPAGIRICN